MYNVLPKELISYIYMYDNTYHLIYKSCIHELKEKWKKQYFDYILWCSHCC